MKDDPTMFTILLHLDPATTAAADALYASCRLSHAASYRVVSASRVALRRSLCCSSRRSDRQGQTG
jgi:hypothetical protein